MKVEDLTIMTFDEAVKAQDEEDKKWLSLSGYPGRSIIQKWTDALYFKDLEKAYKKSKNKHIILAAIFVCTLNDFDLPEWLQAAFRTAYREVRAYRAGSWSEVFGRAHPKGTHLSAKHELREKKYLICNRIRKILDTEPETPVDEALFERVGREFGCGKTKTSEMYYKVKKDHSI